MSIFRPPPAPPMSEAQFLKELTASRAAEMERYSQNLRNVVAQIGLPDGVAGVHVEFSLHWEDELTNAKASFDCVTSSMRATYQQ